MTLNCFLGIDDFKTEMLENTAPRPLLISVKLVQNCPINVGNRIPLK